MTGPVHDTSQEHAWTSSSSGKHVEVSTPRCGRSRSRRSSAIDKFASDVRRIDVDYEQLPTRRADDSHTCEILVHLNQHLVKGTRAGAEHIVALDRALDKVEQQMRRLHERRVAPAQRRTRRRRTAPRRRRRSEASDDSIADVEPTTASTPRPS